jgi:gliding motility-associated-like protein
MVCAVMMGLPAMSYSQCDTLSFTNPSAEGPGYPAGWHNCQGTSNPQPGLFGCTTVASHGNNFLGFHSSDAGGEIIHQELSQALTVGQTYNIIFDLAVTPNWANPVTWGGGGFGNHSGHVEVYASTGPCGLEQLIGSTQIIESSMSWVSIDITFIAENAHQYISFVPYDEQGLWTYFGIDNLRNGHNCDCFPVASSQENVSICEGESHTVGAQTYSTSGEYSNTLSSVFNCDSTVLTSLTVYPTYYSEESMEICTGSAYQGFSQTGVHSLNLQSMHGCDSIRTIDLTVSNSLTARDTLVICQGESVMINNQVVSEEGEYSSAHQAVAGCDSLHITTLIIQEPTVSQQQLLVCDEGPVQIGASVYDSDGYYADTLQTVHGCDSIIITELKFMHANDILPDDEVLCQGDQVYIDLSGYEVDFLFWNDNFASPFISLESSGTHYVDLFWGACHVSDTISLEFHSEPPSDIDTLLCYGDEYPITIDHLGGTIAWEDGYHEEDFIIEEVADMSAQIENVCGSFDFHVRVDFQDCECPIFVPNSFSPNDDGINDSFGVNHDCEFLKYEFYVYDRFGQILFESNDPNDRWNGNFPQTPVAVANSSYTWLMNYGAITPAGKFDYQLMRGTVTVMR